MKELFSFLWASAPEVMSLLCILGILVFIAVKFTLFFVDFKQMGVRISNLEVRMTNVENRLDRLEQKVDQIIQYLLEDRAARQGK